MMERSSIQDTPNGLLSGLVYDLAAALGLARPTPEEAQREWEAGE